MVGIFNTRGRAESSQFLMFEFFILPTEILILNILGIPGNRKLKKNKRIHFTALIL